MAKTEFELFEKWARAKHHYQTTDSIDRFKTMRRSRKRQGANPLVLSAATMALLDKKREGVD